MNDTRTGMTTIRDSPILRERDTCWRREHAARMAVIVDAEAYFLHVQSAILQARHTIMLIGWDFDARIVLNRDDGDAVPCKLGHLLSRAVRRTPACTCTSCAEIWASSAFRSGAARRFSC